MLAPPIHPITLWYGKQARYLGRWCGLSVPRRYRYPRRRRLSASDPDPALFRSDPNPDLFRSDPDTELLSRLRPTSTFFRFRSSPESASDYDRGTNVQAL